MLVIEWGLIAAISVKSSTVNIRIDDWNMVYIYRKYLSNRIYGSSGVPIQENVVIVLMLITVISVKLIYN
jgi:hypothetical protein